MAAAYAAFLLVCCVLLAAVLTVVVAATGGLTPVFVLLVAVGLVIAVVGSGVVWAIGLWRAGRRR